MKRMRTLCLTGLLWMMTCILYAQNQLITYTVPSDGVELKDDFTVRVRQSGSGWKEVVTYPMKVDEVRQTKHHVELASMGYFDMRQSGSEWKECKNACMSGQRVRL
jgi:hypothetical protein